MNMPVTRVRLRRRASLARGASLAAALLVPFLLLAAAVDSSAVAAIDDAAANAVRGLDTAAADALAHAFDAAGSTVGFAVITVLLAAAFLLRGGRSDALLTMAAAAGAWGLNTAAKYAIARPRPVAEALLSGDGFSFPSGNATIAIALFGFAAAAFAAKAGPAGRRWIFAAAAALVLLFGVTRIYAGVHYATDIAGGYLLGGAYLAILAAIRGRIRS